MKAGKESTSFKVSVLDALHYIAKAWKQVKGSTVSNCFLNAGVFKVSEEGSRVEDEEEEEEEDDMLASAWEKLQTDCSLDDFLCIDDEVVTVETVSVEEMVESCMQEDVSEESDNEDDCEDNSVPSHAMVTAAINTIKKYISAADGNSDSFDNLYELENQIEMIHKKNAKQKNNIGLFGQKVGTTVFV
jgi:hypothetical protein